MCIFVPIHFPLFQLLSSLLRLPGSFTIVMEAAHHYRTVHNERRLFEGVVRRLLDSSTEIHWKVCAILHCQLCRIPSMLCTYQACSAHAQACSAHAQACSSMLCTCSAHAQACSAHAQSMLCTCSSMLCTWSPFLLVVIIIVMSAGAALTCTTFMWI